MNENDYNKQCTFCKTNIVMSKRNGSWKPYNINNGEHKCQNGNGKQDSSTETIPKQITLEQVLAKLKSIGIELDLKKLLKEWEYIK
jgi:hypothetical protein